MTEPVAVPRAPLTAWEDRFGVVAGITQRGDPAHPFDLGLAGESPVGPVLDRWRALVDRSGLPGAVVSRQVHGREVAWHPQGRRGLQVLDGFDGHATDIPGLLLTVTVADCLPLFLHDPVHRAIALLHAGWRGVAGRVLAAGLELLAVRAGTRASDVVLHVGPGICGGCYEVGPEVPDALGLPTSPGPDGRLTVDLRAVVADQARRLGVGQVTVAPDCSSEGRDRWFSHRGSGGRDGRMVAYLGLRP